MKNISRRVFIKGMAVAAAATAASTVLAGCNFVPGTEEETPVAGFQPETKTLSFKDDKTFTIGTTGFATAKSVYGIDFEDRAIVSLHMVNDTDQEIQIQTQSNDANKLVVTAYLDSLGEKAELKANNSKDDLYDAKIASNTVMVDSVVDGKLYFTVAEKNKDWKKMTVVCSLKVGTETKEVSFVINR